MSLPALSLTPGPGSFRQLTATGETWREVGLSLIEGLKATGPASLGILYATDALAEDLGSLLTLLRRVGGVDLWAATTGIGIIAGRQDLFDRPAAAVLVADLAPGRAIPIAPGLPIPASPFGGIALVHADPREAAVPQALADLARAHDLFLFGGLASSRSATPHAAGGGLVRGPWSGLWLDPELGIATGLTQGCQPIGPVHRVTAGSGPIIERLDHHPAVSVLKEEVGDLLARNLRRIQGFILAAQVVEASDMGDFMVRPILDIDEATGRIAIGGDVQPGDGILFVRRDHPAAIEDLKRMTARLKARAGGPVTGALYISCLARGPLMFPGGGQTESSIILDILGEDVPLIGFYANGEISHDRLYGYTGVLALMTGG